MTEAWEVGCIWSWVQKTSTHGVSCKINASHTNLKHKLNGRFCINRKEKVKYQLHREKSMWQLSLMEWTRRRHVPALHNKLKSTCNLQTLHTHLMGVLVHTRAPRGKLTYVFCDLLQWQHDGNLVVEVLLCVLGKFGNTICHTLYLQLDNAGNQNKNRYILGFCALLVEKKVFRKVCS